MFVDETCKQCFFIIPRWWKKPITEINLSRTYPKLNIDSTCEQALQAMETNNVNIAVIVDDVG